MFKQIKRVAAMVLIACLFLPLSQCTQPPRPTDAVRHDTVYTRYAIDICPFIQLSHCPQASSGELTKERWLNLVFGIPFILPLLMVLFQFRVKQEKLGYELIDVVLGILVGGVICLHVITGGKLLFGAYVAMLAAAAYCLASLTEVGMVIRKRFAHGDD